ncbi:MAG: hypothetical protein JXB32_03025 [Deltaproteobacteria bacterium]|nr:hypothetical protein [Deltaproteobacteria bacterium]
MTSFRSFLARERLVPVEQLDRALQRQILYGEDLAVNLLEMGVVGEDELAQFLGMFYRLPIVTRSDLESVAAPLLARVPEALALRHRICPVALADEAMVVAAARQLDKAVVDELRKATGTSVSLAVATPVSLAWGLHLHYGAEMPPRFQRLADRQAKPGPASPGPSATPPAAPFPPEEEPERPRRPSGVIVMPDDLPASDRETGSAEPLEGRSTPEASMPPTAPMPVEPAPEGLPEEVASFSTAEEVLRGVSLSHDNPADRLLEMVLGPPSRPPPPPDSEEPGGAPESEVPTDQGVPPPVLPPPESPGADARPLPITKPLPAVPREAPRSPAAEEDPAAAVVRVQSVMLGDAEERPAEPRVRPGTIPPAVEAILQSAPVAPGPRGDLMGRIQRLDALGTPTDVLRYAFQLFSAAFRVGLLFDTTARNPRLRDAFGVRTGAEGYRGRELPGDVIPSPVRNAAQPLLAPFEPESAMAGLLCELFGEVPVNGLFLPVTVGTRVVAVLYGDNRETATAFDSVRDLFHLAWAAGTRLGDLVRRRHRVAPGEAAGDVDDTERGMPPAPTTT